MRKNKPHSESPHQEGGALKPLALAQCPTPSLPAAIRHVDESSLASMAPGDVLVLDDAVIWPHTNEPIFFAVLACPVCGTPGLITSAQYFGTAPIMCGVRECRGLFRVVDEDHLIYLPMN